MIIVDQRGKGDFTTIAAAIVMLRLNGVVPARNSVQVGCLCL